MKQLVVTTKTLGIIRIKRRRELRRRKKGIRLYLPCVHTVELEQPAVYVKCVVMEVALVESRTLGMAHKPGKITASWFPFSAALARWHHDFMSLDFKALERPLFPHWICRTCMVSF
ncbi:hypothetical protein KC357_g284 [Hortaea werneckii]|nr:hypothetical protein KC357_g284 [Hortaea werneckii]